VPVRTFDGWNDPSPGFVEADLVQPVAMSVSTNVCTKLPLATGPL
jgi:hypothetical protein